MRLIRKSRKAFDTAAIARLLRHEDGNGMGRIFMYAFANEVVRMKTPFPFDCETAKVIENNDRLQVVDKEKRSILIENKSMMLSLTLDDKRTANIKRIEYEGKSYRKVLLDWLAACIQYTSLQPKLRKELTDYACSIQKMS